MRLIDHFDRSAQRHPGRACLVEPGGPTLGYAQVRQESVALARALHGNGLRPAAKVAVISPNCAQVLVCVLAILRAGCVWVPVNPGGGEQENAHVLSLCEVELVVFHPTYAALAQRLRQRLGPGCAFACMEEGAAEGFPSVPQLVRRHAAAPEPAVEWSRDDVAAIFCTGGTTGMPKGVMLTHLSWETQLACFFAAMPPPEHPVHLVASPLTHGGGGMALVQMAAAATQVILPRFEPAAVLDAIEQHRVTLLFLPPTAIYRLLAEPGVRGRDYASLRNFIYAAAPMSAQRLDEAIAVFGPVMTQCYGQTEAPGTCTILLPHEHADPALRGSCGRATLLTQVEVMDPQGRLLGPREPGELVVRGNLVMKGYYRDAVQTARALQGGWLRTGDVGWRDEAGYFRIVDRVKDMIISGGFNVYPAEVEQVILAHPQVQDCAVVGLPDEHWGERVAAFVEPRAGQPVDERRLFDELAAACRERLGPVKAPKQFLLENPLPRSPAGKVLRRVVRDRWWEGRDRRV